MATKGKKKPYVKLQCQKCKRINYYIRKSKKAILEKKMELNKFCKWDKEKTPHREMKK